MQVIHWDTRMAGLEGVPRVPFGAVMGPAEDQMQFLRQMRRFGFAIVTGAPADDDDAVLALGNSIGHVRDTNYGSSFTVEDSPDPTNLAYTRAPLQLHTDNPYRDPCPGIQLLHCQTPAPEGGDSVLVDGFAVAERLREEHPEAFAILSTTSRPWRYVDVKLTTDLRASACPIVVDAAGGRVVAVSHNNRSAAPLTDLPADQVKAFYAAMRKFHRLLTHADFRLELKLAAGDVLVLANNRVLHGRTGWDMACARRLRGTYVDSDALWSRLAALEQRPRTAADRADEVLAMIATTKQHEYGENVDMLAHALQAAELATQSGADRDVIVAALCHDVGGAEVRTRVCPVTSCCARSASFRSPWFVRHVRCGPS